MKPPEDDRASVHAVIDLDTGEIANDVIYIVAGSCSDDWNLWDVSWGKDESVDQSEQGAP